VARRTVTNGSDRRVEYTPLTLIEAAPRNPKRHAGDAIKRSIDRFGFAELPLIDERTGRLVAGHGRLDQLAAMRKAGQDPPDGVRVDQGTGEWLVPVVRGWRSRSDGDAEAYLIASNRLTTLGGWDGEELGGLLADLAEQDAELLAVTGFSDADLEGLLGGGSTQLPDALTDPDDVPGTPVEPRSRPGDVWLLGPHRLLVGDATDMAAVEAMLGGDRCDVMWTDPPYGVDYVGKTKDALTIRNDGATDLPELLAGAFAVATAALKPGSPVYVAHPPGALHRQFLDAFFAAGWRFHQGLIWVKDAMVLGHSDYHFRHEPIMFGYTDGAEGRRGRGGSGWYGDHSQTSVFDMPKPARSEDHPTMKPVDLIAPMLANSCPSGGLVYDPFAGSGSTLIAAHRTGRVARVVELDPKYADVSCRRFQEHTGTKPVLESTGEPHDFTGQPVDQ
jgi:DNA modification methylase